MRPRGPKPQPKIRITPAFRTAIHTSGRPMYILALSAGFPHAQSLSTLLYSDNPATALNVDRLRRLAALVHCPADQVFEAVP